MGGLWSVTSCKLCRVTGWWWIVTLCQPYKVTLGAGWRGHGVWHLVNHIGSPGGGGGGGIVTLLSTTQGHLRMGLGGGGGGGGRGQGSHSQRQFIYKVWCAASTLIVLCNKSPVRDHSPYKTTLFFWNHPLHVFKDHPIFKSFFFSETIPFIFPKTIPFLRSCFSETILFMFLKTILFLRPLFFLKPASHTSILSEPLTKKALKRGILFSWVLP